MKTLTKEERLSSLHRFEARTLSGSPLPTIEIKTIFVPLDFSPASLEALNYAIPLAKEFGAAVHLVHVSDKQKASEVFRTDELTTETVEWIEFLRDRLSLIHQKHLPPSWPKNDHVRAGQPYEQICDLAREIHADLIVIGTRGHTGLSRILLGSTAERVVRLALCPVLAVRRREHKQPKEFRLRKILAPVDFSQCSMLGSAYAAFFAKTFDAKLLLLHVFAGVMSAATDKASKDKDDAIDLENARLDLEAFSQLDFLDKVRPATEIRAGYPVDEICREAVKSEIDLVAIATHGRSGFNRVFLGSVAEHVIRYAECPVLVIPGRFRNS
ncbi:MAG TPA: universal stress protein [Candidatus Udaeobacter sp.]|jgi:nucleotide-binding universal stress UspA family protein|nr:universal stress protein [Candidatus Udaeobacter sp.]